MVPTPPAARSTRPIAVDLCPEEKADHRVATRLPKARE
jgi:hypothetical protein